MEKDTLLEQKPGPRFTGFPTKRFTTSPAPPPRRVNLLSNTDDDLTPLNWLVSPNLLRDVCGRPQLTNPPPVKRSPQILRKPMKCMSSQSRPVKTSRSIRLISVKSENHPYKPSHAGHFKPPYSFATLIFMAIEESSHKRLRVSDIYRWILERFPYYRLSDLSWRNSVRHNLSLNRCFQKIDKDRRMECGKGSWWTVDPALRPSLLQALKKIGNVASQVCPNSTEARCVLTANSVYQTPPSSPDSIEGEAAGSDEKTAAAALCMMKRSSEQGRVRHYTPEGNMDKTDVVTHLTPVQSSGPSSNESSPEQPTVEPYRPVKRIISIDKKSAEGVMALLSMANAR